MIQTGGEDGRWDENSTGFETVQAIAAEPHLRSRHRVQRAPADVEAMCRTWCDTPVLPISS
jgi:hypothetical protein